MSLSFLHRKKRKAAVTISDPHNSNSSHGTAHMIEQEVEETQAQNESTQQKSVMPGIPNRLGITEWYNAKSAQADIVFVHGLTGRSYDTWLHTFTNTHWPSQLLPKDIDNVRILSFGYDANVAAYWGGASENRLAEHAENLVGALTGHREDTDTEDRKIVFVAHSLGGLLVEKALNVSESHSEPYMRQIERHTSGIIFLGTPHRGSDIADFPYAIARILQAGGKRINSDILAVLKHDSEVLQEVEDWFYKWLRRRSETGDKDCPISITSFKEELALPGSIIVVKRSSARMEGYDNRSIHADHKNMTKFPPKGHDGHDGYIEVRRAIARCVKQLRHRPAGLRIPADSSAEEEALKQACLQSLFFFHQRTHHDTIYRAMEGSFKWIWSNDAFVSWMTAAEGIFWVAGNPGSGKSTLMKHVFWHPEFRVRIRKAAKAKKVAIAGHFFDYKTHGLARSIEGFYRSIISQLLRQEPRLFDYILGLFSQLQSCQEYVSWTRHDLEQVFRAMISSNQSITGEPVSHELHYCIFVDALDEFDGQDDAIATFLEEITKLAKSNLMVCASSRPKADFIHQFKAYPQLSMHLETMADIALYAHSSCPELSNHPLEDYRKIVEIIIERSEGIFLWVRLVCDRLRKGSRKGETAMVMRNALLDLPTDLFELYKRMFDEIEAEDRLEAHELLAIVSAAPRTLTLRELRCVLALNASSSFVVPPTLIKRIKNEADVEEYIEYDRLQNRIRGICGGLIETRPSGSGIVVVPIHATTRTFLCRSRVSTGTLRAENMACQGHLIMLNATTRYLQMLSEADLPFQRSDFHFQTRNGVLTYQFPENDDLDDGQSMSSSKWSMTTTPGEPEYDSFVEWSAPYNFLIYSVVTWSLHAQLSEVCCKDYIIEYVDRIHGPVFQIWREIFWEYNKSTGGLNVILEDMPHDVLEHAFASNCVLYAQEKLRILDLVNTRSPERLLVAAIRAGNLELCRLLLTSFERHQFLKTNVSESFLHLTVDFSRPEMIPMLTAYGFNQMKFVEYTLRHQRWEHCPDLKVSGPRKFRCTVLDLAVLLHRNDIAHQLIALITSHMDSEKDALDLGNILSDPRSSGHTFRPVNTTGVRLLLENGISPNIKPGFHPRFTPLGFAIKQQNWILFKNLISHGADFSYSNQEESMLSFAIHSNWKPPFDAARCLLLLGAKADSLSLLAALRHRLDILDEVLRSNKFEIDFYRYRRRTLLHQSVLDGNIDGVRMLRDSYHADPDIPDDQSDCPVHSAFIWDEETALSLVKLLCSGTTAADLTVVNRRGRTPFELAAHLGYTRVIKSMMNYGLQVAPDLVQKCIDSMSTAFTDPILQDHEKYLVRHHELAPPSESMYRSGLDIASRVHVWVSSSIYIVGERTEWLQSSIQQEALNFPASPETTILRSHLQKALEVTANLQPTSVVNWRRQLSHTLAKLLESKDVAISEIDLPYTYFEDQDGNVDFERAELEELNEVDPLWEESLKVGLKDEFVFEDREV